MVKRKLGALEKVDADLPNLQHKIRRDPLSYQADFEGQYSQYVSLRGLFEQSPASASETSIISLRDLIDFVAHVADCYPTLTTQFSAEVAELLTKNHKVLEPGLREKLVGSLTLLRKKEIIDSAYLLNVLFPVLVSTPSKSLRTLLYQKIISDIRASNIKHKNHKLNRTLQSVLYNLVASERASAKAIWAVRITRELWRRQIWTDARAVEIMKEAALAENAKVVLGGVNFFLGGDKERQDKAEEDSSSEGEDNAIDMGRLRHQAGVTKKTRKKARELKAATATVKRLERKKNKPHPLNFSALHLLHDPQGFAELLFSRHLQNANPKVRLNLEQKLQVLQLVTRLVGLHELTVISLYSYFLKYLTPRQASVTSFLASLSQSVHSRVPPDAIEPLIIKIANEFVSEAASGQVAAAGLNAIREICARQPLAMTDTLLQDLVMYRKSKDKGVMMAAKGLLSLYRQVGADKLRKRDRGREAALDLRDGLSKERRFGEVDAGGIEGLELLAQFKEDERRKRRLEMGLDPDASDAENDEKMDEEDWKAWDVEEDDSESSGGWIDVESDGEDIDISDSDEESKKRAAKKAKLDDQDHEQGKSELDPAVAEQTAEKEAERFSKLATTKILTPADLAKLNELRLQAAVKSQMPGSKQRKTTAAPGAQRHKDDPLTAAEIEGWSALGKKATKEEKIAAAKGDRDETHQSATARRKEKKREAGKSTTNKEKARKKNLFMTLGKAKGKQKRSLVEKSKVLKGHVDRQKRGGRRGNNQN